jgi:hypothetical protein
MGECQVCDDIWQMFVAPENAKRAIKLGTFEEALALPCSKHTPILESFKDHVGSSCSSSSTIIGFRNSGHIRERGRSRGPHIVVLCEGLGGPGQFFDMLLVNKVDAPDHPGIARILNPYWVDMDLLRYWICQCCGLHASCTTAMNVTPTIPALLVDVKRRCVVSGASRSRYVALSYRFGGAAYFRLDGVLFNRLRQESALDDPDILNSLPLTVRNAIALVEELGESYLWTDSLCITHEDPGALAGQLEQMAAIYSSALFTIVALDGDGSRGILGLPGISEPRKLTQRVFEFGTDNLIVRSQGREAYSEHREYHKRGWTYQEFLMSARKLVFLGGEAQWMCQCCQWHEELAPDVEINTYIDHNRRLLIAGLPDLWSLGQILDAYNQRSLTYDEDAFPAIAGLISVLSRTFTGGFLHGLPEMMFDAALGWDVSWDSSALTKRAPSQPVQHDQDTPTWS